MKPNRQSVKRQAEESDDEDNEYEQMRKKNLEEKMLMLRQLGIPDVLEELNTPVKVETSKSANKTPRKHLGNTPLPTRRSSRLSNKSHMSAEEKIKVEDIEKEIKPLRRHFLQDPECMEPVGDDVKPSLVDLLPYLSNISKGEDIDKSLEEYKLYLKKFVLKHNTVRKVGTAQSRSFIFHPSQEKLLAITGDKNGYIGFWDVDNENKDVEWYRPHKKPVFCMSVSTTNPAKLYATSIDGIVRSCDLQKMQFSDIYVTDPIDHTPYHAQVNAHTLLVAHGSGAVALVDEREPRQVSCWVQCHHRSVRTVHRHPFKEYEFATASRLSEASIWDMRKTKNKKPLIVFPHPKGLKSAFFSPGGGMLLTSCNDDKLRLYIANKPQVVMSRAHNMQTGRWLNPFQATWHPHRDDIFIIGNLNKPRQVDICGIHGLPIVELKSNYLLTVLSNCQFHQTLPVIGGVNNSGYVHIFKNYGK